MSSTRHGLSISLVCCLRIFVLSSLCALSYLTGAEPDYAAPGDDLILIEGSEFEIVSDDRISGNELKRKTEVFGRFIRKIFGKEGDVESWPVRVEWVEPQKAREPWRISWGGLNQVILRLGAEHGESDRILYEALSAAWLMREAVHINGSEAVDTIPEWLISALALDFIKSRYPSADAPWSDLSRLKEPRALNAVMDLSYAELMNDWALATHAWYLFD